MAGDTNGTAGSAESEFWLFGYGSLIWKPPPHFDRRVPGYVTGYVRRFWQDHRGTPEAPGRVVTLIERDFWASLLADPATKDVHDSAPDRVWGVAYRIRADKVAEVKEYLDIREINGYTIHYTDFQPAAAAEHSSTSRSSSSNNGTAPPSAPETIKTLVYIGTPDNPQFTGPQEPQALAEHIRASHGPSGANREYLLNLETALNALSPPDSGDAHITDLCDRVRALDDGGDDARHVDGADRGKSKSSGDRGGGGGGGGGGGVDVEATAATNHFRRRGSVVEQEETEK
ncbi:ChaC-like protein-domain-containing protein [Microdochium bolleyi]|uniref:glutathione-specific gamma-glutamylcyclotransferase n=1 Tax=Microdochium bolleyi TaxID=196109 RepID=A0A136JF43_9PEZI|nr:ChaC-like protein-domain-containing protein [Microdochium bolleyi]